jgi:septal ring factor EnvC (AmiA/AmiB activator)
MPPKLKPDDLVEALLDGRVVEALAKALSPFIQKTIDECLSQRLADFSKALHDVKASNDRLQSQVGDLKRENVNLRRQVTSYESRLDALETYSQLDNLIVKGLPE